MRLVRQLPTTENLVGAHVFVPRREAARERASERAPMPGGWCATPLLAVLVVIEASDIIFAADSIPAIFGVPREPFLVFSATALALLRLRSMYFLLAGARGRVPYLDVGLAVILVFIGVKFLLSEVIEIGVGIPLLVIVGAMTTAIVASLRSGLATRPE